MTNIKKYILPVIIILISLILIIIGLVFYKFNMTKNNNSKNQVTISKNEYNNQVNDSSTLSKKHCLDGLCITNLKITKFSSGFCVVSGKVVNNNDETIMSGFTNLIFIVNGKQIKKYFYYGDLVATQFYYLESQYIDDDILYATDYIMATPSKNEIKQYEKHIRTN